MHYLLLSEHIVSIQNAEKKKKTKIMSMIDGQSSDVRAV